MTTCYRAHESQHPLWLLHFLPRRHETTRKALEYILRAFFASSCLRGCISGGCISWASGCISWAEAASCVHITRGRSPYRNRGAVEDRDEWWQPQPFGDRLDPRRARVAWHV